MDLPHLLPPIIVRRFISLLGCQHLAARANMTQDESW
jgi:hypothetical protein